MPDDALTKDEMFQLRNLLGKWVRDLSQQDRNSVLLNASELTYVFVNTSCDFMELPPDPNNSNQPEIT